MATTARGASRRLAKAVFLIDGSSAKGQLGLAFHLWIKPKTNDKYE
ncbi:MAG: hypothetical protein ACI8QI_002458 [Limisphaerales bacterium]|jgi:hypothetical protein